MKKTEKLFKPYLLKSPEHLKPCPFCGAQAKLEWMWSDNDLPMEAEPVKIYVVSCSEDKHKGKCSTSALTTASTRSEAIQQWNQRAPIASAPRVKTKTPKPNDPPPHTCTKIQQWHKLALGAVKCPGFSRDLDAYSRALGVRDFVEPPSTHPAFAAGITLGLALELKALSIAIAETDPVLAQQQFIELLDACPILTEPERTALFMRIFPQPFETTPNN